MTLGATTNATPNLVVIFGPPASGKAAVGHELSELIGYRFFHNHLTTEATAALFGWDNERFDRVLLALRELMFREAAADPSIPGVIFTFVWAFNAPEDQEFMESVASLFSQNGGKVLFVELLASLQTRITREGTPFRVGLKPGHRDVKAARARQIDKYAKFRMNTAGSLPIDHPHLIVDTETLEPSQSADLIASHVRQWQ